MPTLSKKRLPMGDVPPACIDNTRASVASQRGSKGNAFAPFRSERSEPQSERSELESERSERA